MERKVTVRLPENVHGMLVEVAEKDRRSTNSEILVFIEEGIARRRTSQRETEDQPQQRQNASNGAPQQGNQH